ncbi:MAG TPA: hypothetical protein VNW99_07515 [Cytophagaceae bacterium]|jgi:hypothetical protein|nr:hypothetical protein [Cytophagaceae bacterium]
MQKDKIIFNQARDFSEKLNDTFSFLRQNFKNLSTTVLFVAGPFTLIGGIFLGLYQSQVFKSGFLKQTSLSDRFQNIFGIEYLMGILFSMISLSIVSIVVNEYIRLYNEDKTENFQWQDVLPGVKSNFLPIFLYGIGYAILVMIGMMLLIFPGVYLAIALSFLFSVKMFEGKGFFESVSRCLNLIKGNWWATFGLLFVLSIIQGLLSFIFQIPAFISGIVMGIQGLKNEASGGSDFFLIIATIISTTGSQLLYTVSIVGLIFQYFNLVEEKDATGLLGRIDSIGKTPDVKTSNEESY